MQGRKTDPSKPPSADSCPVCTLQPLCVPWDLEPEDVRHLEHIVEQPAVLAPGTHLFRFGDPLRAIYVVRTGAFKIYRTDTWGRERVLGFGLPGELVGIDGIYSQRHVSHAIALRESAVCALPYAELAERMEESEGLRRQIFRLVSRDTGHNIAITRDSSADERVARFLLDMSRRAERQGRSPVEIDLPMSRSDLSSYLHMSADGVERVLRRFTARELLAVGRDGVQLRDRDQLDRIAGRK